MRFKGSLIALLMVAILMLPVFANAEWIGVYHFKHLDAQGNVIAEWESNNSLADEGEKLFLDVVLRGGTAPVEFYLGLSDSTSTCSIVDTDTIITASAGEPTTNGYTRQLIERSSTGWPTLALDAGDYQATASTETFSAGGSWGPVYCAYITTAKSNGTVWAASTAYSLNAFARPTTFAGYVYEATTAGTSGTAEPTWNTTIGGTTTDGTVTWTTRLAKLISYTALSTGRTLAAGETLQVTYKVKLQ